MANLIEYIQSQVYENSTEDISGSIMQQVLTRMASDEGVVNVHTISGQTPFADYNNAQAARDAVPDGFKKLGLIITYKLSSGWYIDEFIGTATSGWSTASNWKCLGPISVSQNASTGKTTITIGSESFDVATQPVSVSQNLETGHTDITIGSETTSVLGVDEKILGKIDLTEQSAHIGYISEEGLWVQNAGYVTYIIPVAKNTIVQMKANNVAGFAYSFLKSMPTFVGGSSVDWCDNTGLNSVDRDSVKIDTIPTDAYFMSILGSSQKPDKIEFTYPTIVIGAIGNGLFFNFRSNKWYLETDNDGIIVSLSNGKSIVASSNVSIGVSSDAIGYAIINDNGSISVVDSLVDVGISSYILARFYLRSDGVGTIHTLARFFVNGNPYNLPIASNTQNGILSKENLQYLYGHLLGNIVFDNIIPKGGIIDDNGEWLVYNPYFSYIVPAIPSMIYAITASNSSNSVYTFLSEEPDYVAGHSVSFATGYTGLKAIPQGTTELIQSPSDAKYLYILGYGDYMPASVVCQGLNINTNDFLEVYKGYEDNYPIIPNELYVLDDASTPLFKKSIVRNPFNFSDCNFIGSTEVNSRRRFFEINEPTNLNYDAIGNILRVTLEGKLDEDLKCVYKDITIRKTTVASKSGATPKILMIGDSITHGDHGAQSSPIVMAHELLQSRYGINPTMIGTFAPFSVNGEGRGCFSFDAMVGKNNNPFGFYHFVSVGGDLEDASEKVTTQFQNPFTFPATATDKASYPEWCFTNNNNYPDEPDGLSYADATETQKANCHFFIFDYARYLGLWDDAAHTPDIITIALGTNDWQPSGLINLNTLRFCLDEIYTRIRSVQPNVKLVFVSAQNIPISLQQTRSNGSFPNEIAPVITNIQKFISTKKSGGDLNIFELPIYACSSRWLSFSGYTAGSPSDLAEYNNVQVMDINTDVHVLDGIGNDSYWGYIDSLLSCLVYLS